MNASTAEQAAPHGSAVQGLRWFGGYGWGGPQRYPIETKPFFLTSEFFGVLVLIAAMAISAGTNDGFDARLFWILTASVVGAYVLSRGIAKSGTKSQAFDPREDIRLFEGGQGDDYDE